MKAELRWRLAAGGLINQVLLLVPVMYLSGVYMDIAAAILGEQVAWPQIGFMSAYPSDVRNGYLLFAAAVLTVVFVSSGIIAGLLGASMGKAICGVRYVDSKGAPASIGRFMLRGLAVSGVMSAILLPGPILGFVFGSDVDNLSLISLSMGLLFTIWALFGIPPGALSPVNRLLGMQPTLRSETKEI